MFTLNGFGIKYLGISKPDGEGRCLATRWFVILYLPIFPLGRDLIKPIKRNPRSFQFLRIQKERLSFLSILKTYFFAWILMPLVLFAPLILGIHEIQDQLGVPQKFQIYVMILGIGWLISAVLFLKNWEEKRGFKK